MGLITEEQRTEAASPAMGLGRHTRMEGERSDNAEITLGMRSLLGIFFGLVLICGIFFGLGYSVGRSGGTRAAASEDAGAAQAAANANLKKPSAEQQQQSLTPVPAPTTEAGDNGQTAENGAAPAATGLTESNTPGATGSGATSSAPAQPASAAPQTAEAQPAPANHPAPAQTAVVRQPTFTQPAPAPTPRRAVVPQSFTPAPTAPAQPATNYATNSYGSGTYMVQIAAVRMQQDASVLVSALQRRGYNVVVRHEAQDTLLHVQIGPFTSRTQAFAMRSRLLADGYNAVVK